MMTTTSRLQAPQPCFELTQLADTACHRIKLIREQCIYGLTRLLRVVRETEQIGDCRN